VTSLNDTLEERSDSLRAELSRRGVTFTHTQNRDLEVIVPSGVWVVIERVHAIYEALGQLFYHTRATDPDAILVVAGRAVRHLQDGTPRACYGEPTEAVFRERLRSSGVHLLLATSTDDGFRWGGIEISFMAMSALRSPIARPTRCTFAHVSEAAEDKGQS
jgi:hypothetical protein